MKGFVTVVNKINYSMLWILGTIIFVLSILLFYDVMMRYLFSSPTRWAFDLSGWMTGVTAFLAGGFALLTKEHVRVDIFYQTFSRRTQAVIDVATSVFLFLIVIVLVWNGGNRMLHYYELGSVANTGLNIAIWIKWIMVPLGGLLLGLQAIVQLIQDIYTAYTGKGLWEEESA